MTSPFQTVARIAARKRLDVIIDINADHEGLRPSGDARIDFALAQRR